MKLLRKNIIAYTLFGILFGLALMSSQVFATQEFEEPVLVVGASYENGKIPFNDGLTSPLFGIAIGGGSFLDIGQGIVRRNNFVINEAQAGATTFDRDGCNPGPLCGPGKWDSYETQLNRAVARVFNPVTGTLNASYVIFGMANDCLHSDAFGIPQDQTTPCSAQELSDVAARMVSVGNMAINLGLTPVFSRMPKYSNLDLAFTQQAFGFNWVIDEASYESLRCDLEVQLSNLPGAIFVNRTWNNFKLLKDPSGNVIDGIHPDFRTVKKATRRILNKIEDHQEQ